ncbi:hypothetical protein [Bacteroides acidifaciens]|uniref:hypothetical protein n=1 Tax=Bacteroides acidifaciens TaxID=85831 RepID=UPI003F69124B
MRYTGVEQTVYNISNVPTENINVIRLLLLILHDWSNAINLADKEIDKRKRGVIRERMEKAATRYASVS